MACQQRELSNECTWPEIRQRAHYLSWLATAVGTAALVGLTIDLLVVAVTGGNVGMEVIPLVYACAVLSPSVYVWRKHGEARCGFLELEHAVHEAINEPGHRGAALLQIFSFVERIERARGMERQVVRNEAKAWLLAHRDELTREEREYVADHLGYLHRR